MEFKLPIPTLERVLLIKTATILWKYNNSQLVSFSRHLNEKWPELEKTISTKIDTLTIPPNLKKSLRQITKFVGEEILAYLTSPILIIFSNQTTIDFLKLLKCINHIEWTPHGKIDFTKTARALSALDEQFTLHERYTIASAFCVKDAVEHIWTSFPDQITNIEFSNDPLRKIDLFWTDMMKNKAVNKDRKFELFDWFLQTNNVSGIKYVWTSLSEEETMVWMMSRIMAPLFGGTGSGFEEKNCFLLLQMEEQELNSYFPTVGVGILREIIRDWVYVDLFVSAADRVRGKLDVTEFRDLIHLIVVEILKNRDDDRYKMCFEHLWTNGSSLLRKGFVDFEIRNDLRCTCLLLGAMEFECVNLLLESLSDVNEEMRNRFFELYHQKSINKI